MFTYFWILGMVCSIRWVGEVNFIFFSFLLVGGGVAGKLKSLGKRPNTAKKKKFQYQWKSFESTLILDFN